MTGRMDRVNQKMKKIRGVFDGLRQSVAGPKAEAVEETLQSDHFKLAKTVRHGFPHQPTAMAWDSVQHLLAIGTKSGSVRIFGRPGVDCHVKHEGDVAVIQITFLVNEGAMITACSDDQLHLWNLRQKKPEIVHSLRFQREVITCCHLPFQSKWLYVGSKRGNVHVVNIESFVLSGYIINWNKTIELMRKTHPGAVVHLSDNPQDPNKMMVGFETGLIVLWDLRSKTADLRVNTPESLRSLSWHQDGKQFMASHQDGSLSVWNTKCPTKPQSILMPHAKMNSDGKPEPCRPILKVEWKCTKTGEPYMIFSGGMPKDRAMRSPALTVMHAKSTTVLEMEHNVIDFITLCSTPWDNDFQDPFGIVVLLENDLVVVDLTTPGYPCFENPYPMDLHEAPVTACEYVADCPHDIIPALYQVGFKQKKSGFSEKEWPVKGGEWGTPTCSYPEVVISGHADGSLKFWDASAATLQVLYKLKTAKLFDKSKCSSAELDDDPFAIQHIHFCVESRSLCVAGVSHVILFKFNKQETSTECTVIETAIVYEICEDVSPEMEYPPVKHTLGSVSQQSDSMGSYNSSTCSEPTQKQETSLRVKSGSKKWSAGYHPDLCCLLQWLDGEPPPPITSLSFSSKFDLVAFGNECGIAILDIAQKCCLLSMGTPDLYGSMDPYSRAPRSPKNKSTSQPSSIITQNAVNADENRSPTSEQFSVTRLPSAERTRKHSRPQTTFLEKITETDGELKVQKRPFRSHKSFDEEYFKRATAEAELLGIESGDDVMAQSMNMQALREVQKANSDTVYFKEPPKASTAASSHESITTSTEFESFDFVPECENMFKASDVGESASGLKADDNNGGKKNKKGFFHQLIHKSDGKESTSGGQKNDKKSTQEMRFSDLRNSSEMTEDVTKLQLSPTTKDSPMLDSGPATSISSKHSEHSSQQETLKAEGHDYLDAPGTLHRESKSDYALTQKSTGVPNTSTVDNISGLTTTATLPSPGALEHPCDPALDTVFTHSSQKQPNTSCDSSSISLNNAPVKSDKIGNKSTTLLPSPNADTDHSNTSHTDEVFAEVVPVCKQTIASKRESFVRKLSRKMKGMGGKATDVLDDSLDGVSFSLLKSVADDKRKKAPTTDKFEVIDLTDEDIAAGEKPPTRKMTYNMIIGMDGSFSRSRSSSMSSLENISKEAIQSLVFADAYTRKTDTCTCPSLWVGTSLGSVLVINLQLPTEQDRATEAVVVSPSGTIFRLRRGILCMSFLDCNGLLMGATPAEPPVQDAPAKPDVKESKKTSTYQRQQSQMSLNSQLSTNSCTELYADRQFAIICSERHARVISLPSQTCAYSHKITDTSFVVVASVISIKDTACLACYIANGHIITFSLPSLRPMLDADYLPLTDLRIAKTFQFSNNGHALYFCSPSEIQKLTLSSEICGSLDEMLGELFLPCDTPEAPKKTFLQNLFSGGASTLDREELFGEASGKPAKSVARYSPGNAGMQQTQERAGAATSEIGRAKMAAIERGEKLGQLSDTTERLRDDSEQYSHNAHQIMQKFKNKKWYQF